ncbi:NAD kinase [Oxobacter pfennigii]|uniref:NAD kinase n=1 Tax=Oxobacter pfennigii TaxID=36849 RepID=A0A0N8NTI2_9CLOT|nr:NAD(+)/NADH kinase [Oxobacter pfennigii]KPU44904.1 NAD kinase [Oxobacter pfennigii]
MNKIGIIVNIDKDKDLSITKNIINWIGERGGTILLSKSIASKLNLKQYSYKTEDIYKQSDFILVLGGDGTILGVSREVSKYDTPLLGINLGHLGFLAEVEVKEIFESLEKTLNGEFHIENRIMLEAKVAENGIFKKFYALNDIAFTRGTLSRILRLKVYINDDYVTSLSGDGLIIASPTGSTAYSLSAGGPIISPNLSVMTLTPICPHSLFNKSIVISDSETVRVDLEENYGNAYLTVDGQEGYKINEGQYVSISKAPFCTRLIKLSNRTFYDVLRTKITER